MSSKLSYVQIFDDNSLHDVSKLNRTEPLKTTFSDIYFSSWKFGRNVCHYGSLYYFGTAFPDELISPRHLWQNVFMPKLKSGWTLVLKCMAKHFRSMLLS